AHRRQLLPRSVHAVLELHTVLVPVLYGAARCLTRASALMVSVIVGGCPGKCVSLLLFVEQLLPGLDPVAHGHVGGPSDRGGARSICSVGPMRQQESDAS